MDSQATTTMKHPKIWKTSREWQKLNPLMVINDPDGWDRTNFRFSWHEEKITKAEYSKRASKSTCIFKDR